MVSCSLFDMYSENRWFCVLAIASIADCHVDSELSREGLRRLRLPSSWTGLLELGCGFIRHGDFDAVLQAARDPAILPPLHRNPVSSALRAMPLLQRRSYRFRGCRTSVSTTAAAATGPGVHEGLLPIRVRRTEAGLRVLQVSANLCARPCQWGRGIRHAYLLP